MKNRYDVIVVGAGPAGISAALTLRMRSKDVLVCYSDLGALKDAHRVDNYPGLPEKKGADMVRVFHKQAIDSGVDMLNAPVRQILPMGKQFSLLAGEQILTCDKVILAVGVMRKSSLRGEQEAAGKGVSYCATCDGMFYRGKKIAVLSSYREGVEEANFLSSLAGETLYFSEKPHDIEDLSDKVTVMDGKVQEILMENGRVSAVMVGDEAIKVDGVFILRPATPPSQLLPGLELENGKIKTDEHFRTSVENVYACGDCVGAPYQIAWAAGTGNAAALAASGGSQSR